LFPDSQIYACDLDKNGVDYCHSRFGANPIYSREELSEVDLGNRYDIIWVGSLFTHTSRIVRKRWMTHLANTLTPNGIVIATVLGRWGEHAYKYIPYIAEDRWQNVTDEYNLSGYGYSDYPPDMGSSSTTGVFGMSLARPFISIKDIEDIAGTRIFFYQERGWADHQDVIAFGGPSADAPWELLDET
jgi:hypothetical protein